MAMGSSLSTRRRILGLAVLVGVLHKLGFFRKLRNAAARKEPALIAVLGNSFSGGVGVGGADTRFDFSKILSNS